MIRVNEEEDCPSQDFEPGEPQGKCWSDNHYECLNCKHFRADFKVDPEKREKLLIGMGAIQFRTLKR